MFSIMQRSGPHTHTHTHTLTHTHTHTHTHCGENDQWSQESRGCWSLHHFRQRFLTAEWTQAKGIPPLHMADNKQAAAVWSASGWEEGELEGDRKLRGKLELDGRQSRKLPANWAKNRSVVEHCSWNIFRSHLFSLHSGGDCITFKQEAVSMNNNNSNDGFVDQGFPSRLIHYSSRGILRQTQQASKRDCLSSWLPHDGEDTDRREEKEKEETPESQLVCDTWNQTKVQVQFSRRTCAPSLNPPLQFCKHHQMSHCTRGYEVQKLTFVFSQTKLDNRLLEHFKTSMDMKRLWLHHRYKLGMRRQKLKTLTMSWSWGIFTLGMCSSLTHSRISVYWFNLTCLSFIQQLEATSKNIKHHTSQFSLNKGQ